MTAQQTTPKNSLTFDDMRNIARDLGKQSGTAKDTQIRFLMKVVEASFFGSIDTTKNKHGANIDDSTVLAEDYYKAQTGSTMFDAKAGNQRKLASITRACVHLGMWPKGGPSEPLATANKLIFDIRAKERAKPGNVNKLDDAANTLLKYAREQVKRDSLVSDAELQAFCFKKNQSLQTPEQILKDAHKKLSLLIAGKSAHNTAHDDSEHVKKAREEIGTRLKEIAEARQAAKEAAAKAA